jgi:hypothetical protein
MNVTSEKDTQFELIRVQPVDPSEQPENLKYDSFALYTHPDCTKEWRHCRILMKVSRPAQNDKYRIEFAHEAGHNYLINREDVLLSFEYKRT